MPSNGHYDVIIIGTGAGGGTVAHSLAPTGKRILLLERGGFVPRERENWISSAVITAGRYNAAETWRDERGNAFHPGTHYNVGGNTKFYGAALWRHRVRDFEALRHSGGISPAWPLRYDHLEPYYTAAERLYHVHGNRGADPTDPWASSDYPYPAVSHEPRIQQLHDDLVRIGHRPFPAPVGIRLDENAPLASACIRCSTCDGFPCLLNAKSDADVLCVRPALSYPNVTLLTHAKVTRLETGPSGREVSRVLVEREGEVETYTADIVVLSCGAINSAALLLRSASDRHPRGLANSSGVVGRNYMCHNNTMLLALSKTPNGSVFNKTFALNDFYFGADDWGYPLGCMQMIGRADVEMLHAGAPPGTPRAALDVMSTHALPFWLTSEDLPDPQNRVELDRDGGIRLIYRENNLDGHRRLIGKLKGMLGEIGCDHEHLVPANLYIGKKIPLAGVAHQCGTARFGHDPADSALDVDCKAHDLDNLYVVDASFFVSSAAVNPALTIIANALRVSEHLRERLGTRRTRSAGAAVETASFPARPVPVHAADAAGMGTDAGALAA
jgi:choline dehydrogenase-like flavoprotein